MTERLKAYLDKKGLTVDETKVAARQAIIEHLRKAREDNKAFLAIPTPSAAERNAQIAMLTRQNPRMMRLLTNELDGDD